MVPSFAAGVQPRPGSSFQRSSCGASMLYRTWQGRRVHHHNLIMEEVVSPLRCTCGVEFWGRDGLKPLLEIKYQEHHTAIFKQVPLFGARLVYNSFGLTQLQIQQPLIAVTFVIIQNYRYRLCLFCCGTVDGMIRGVCPVTGW